MLKPMITLLTDFGDADGYVGVMKGVIWRIVPDARMVDLSHAIPPQDVAAGAFVLGQSAPAFPSDTIHLAVVDPGVGGPRRPVLVETLRGWFVGPDNGLGTPLFSEEIRAYVLDRPAYWRLPLSQTFHGRDLFAPVAAHLARGVRPTDLGSPVPPASLIRLPPPPLDSTPDRVTGAIVYLDRFGNALTNIPAHVVARLQAGGGSISVTLGVRHLGPIHASYDAVPPGAPVALISSGGCLEIAVREGHAGRTLGCRVGDPVVLIHMAPGSELEGYAIMGERRHGDTGQEDSP